MARCPRPGPDADRTDLADRAPKAGRQDRRVRVGSSDLAPEDLPGWEYHPLHRATASDGLAEADITHGAHAR